MDLIIVRKDGTTYNTGDCGMKVLQFSIGSPTPKNITEDRDDRDGFDDLGTFYSDRKIKATLRYFSEDSPDNTLAQGEIFKMFDSRESFYLIDSRQKGKRWVAKCESSFIPEQRGASFGDIDISFIAQPYAESVGTTLDPMTFSVELWGVGMGLDESVATAQSIIKWTDIGAKKWSEL